MKYVITMMSGKKYKIEAETANKLVGKQGLVFINEINCAINLNSVEVVEPEDVAQKTNKEMMKEGRLHDGTKVIKKFGKWVDAYNPDVNFDLSYYPELAKDEIMSEEEYKTKQDQKLLKS